VSINTRVRATSESVVGDVEIDPSPKAPDPHIRKDFYYYYEQQVKRELKRIHISGYRCNERLKAKTDGSKCLT
jgi:hypothetical protein